MKRIALSVILACGLVAAPPPASSDDIEPDNSGRNVRDREAEAVTPGDQSNAEGDVRITQEIRKAVVADDTLSFKARNVKIITIDGVVTLRGPVDNEEERTNIANKARKVAGVVRVQNDLEVARE